MAKRRGYPSLRLLALGALLGGAPACAGAPPPPAPAPVAATTPPAPMMDQPAVPAASARFAPWLQEPPRPPEDFVALAPFAPESPQRACAARSTRAWSVALADGQVRLEALDATAHRFDPLPAGLDPAPFERPQFRRRVVQTIEDGWIIALSGVESGGEIWWASRDLSRVSMVLAKPAVSFVETPKGLVVALGLAYVTTEYGEVVRLVRDPRDETTGWRVEPLVDLREVPRAMAPAPDGSVLLVTPRALFRVDLESGRQELLYRGQWLGLHPNSVTPADDGSIYIGMRHAVVRLDPGSLEGGEQGGETAYRASWLVPRACTKTADAEDPCACDERSDETLRASAP